jgi:hypothetical protein
MFLYSDDGLFDQAYLIIPDEQGPLIEHQYGCVSCLHLRLHARIEVIPPGPLVDILRQGLSCDHWTADVLALKTGLPIADVLGEACARLADGRYIATENCD